MYVLAFSFRSLVFMTLNYDATSSVLAIRDFCFDKSEFIQCKMSYICGRLKISALVIFVRITSVRVNTYQSYDINDCRAPGSHKQGFRM